MKIGEFDKARNYAFRLLGYRPRSSSEIKQRLEKKGVSPAIIQEIVAYLTQLKHLNDADFARFWIRSKMDSRPLGWSMLRYQLRHKGLDRLLIEKVIAEVSGQYDQLAIARSLIEQQRNRCLRLGPLKLKKRLYDFLARRGFSQEIISQVMD